MALLWDQAGKGCTQKDWRSRNATTPGLQEARARQNRVPRSGALGCALRYPPTAAGAAVRV
jgi:hypothetical protein